MQKDSKQDLILLRISKSQKFRWKTICKKRNISLTGLIIHSVEGRIQDDERRKVLAFIEIQDNIFKKIETNINQVAKMVNGQRYISEIQLKDFTTQLQSIVELKEKQNQIFIKIYALLSDDC